VSCADECVTGCTPHQCRPLALARFIQCFVKLPIAQRPRGRIVLQFQFLLNLLQAADRLVRMLRHRVTERETSMALCDPKTTALVVVDLRQPARSHELMQRYWLVKKP
jgi:hypothetical protein